MCVCACVCAQLEECEEEPLLRKGCKEYFWLLCKLIDNIHVKDASQVGAWPVCASVSTLRVRVSLNRCSCRSVWTQKVSPSLSLAASVQTTLLDLDSLARHLADCIRRSDPGGDAPYTCTPGARAWNLTSVFSP